MKKIEIHHFYNNIELGEKEIITPEENYFNIYNIIKKYFKNQHIYNVDIQLIKGFKNNNPFDCTNKITDDTAVINLTYKLKPNSELYYNIIQELAGATDINQDFKILKKHCKNNSQKWEKALSLISKIDINLKIEKDRDYYLCKNGANPNFCHWTKENLIFSEKLSEFTKRLYFKEITF